MSTDRVITCEDRMDFGAEVVNYVDLPDDMANLFVDFMFPYDGVVSGWEYYSLRNDIPVYAAVYR